MLEDQIKQYLEGKYHLGVNSLGLLRSYTNEVYLINSKQGKYVLKLYPKAWRSEDEVLWEVDLINFLSEKGINAAKVVDGTNIAFDQNYSALLFEYAKGEKPKEPFTLDLQYSVGKAAGMLHKESESFSSNHQRKELNLEYLIDNSTVVAEKAISNKEEFNLYKDFGIKLKNSINLFMEEGLDWGVVHGDLTLDNMHVTSEGKIVFYDFDSAGFGFRAMELYGWTGLYPDKKSTAEAFLKGYQEVREINKINIEASPFLQAAQDMWLDKGMKALKDPEILRLQLNKVKDWQKYFRDNNLLETK